MNTRIPKSLLLLMTAVIVVQAGNCQTSNEIVKSEILEIITYHRVKNSGFPLPGDFITEGDRVVGIELTKMMSQNGNEYPLSGFGTANFSSNKVFSLTEHRGQCYTNTITAQNLEFERDQQNRITAIKEKGYYQSSGNMRDFYELEYDQSSRISSFTRFVTLLKGKTMKDFTEDFSYMKKKTDLSWSGDGSELVVLETEFQSKKKQKDPSTPLAPTKFVYGFSNGQITSYQQISGNGQIVQDLRTTATKDSVEVIATNQTLGSKSIITYYLSQSLIARSHKRDFDKDGKITSRIETSFEYTFQDGSKDLCKAKMNYLAQQFDADGTILYERNPTHRRQRNSDGTWGEWVRVTY